MDRAQRMNEADDTSTVSPTPPVSSFGVSHPALSQDEIYQALLKADKSQKLAPIASSLAQELNDLLTRIMGAVASLPKTKNNHIEQAEEAVVQAREITKRLQALSLPDTYTKREIKVEPIINQVVSTIGISQVAKIQCAVQPDLGNILGDPAELNQILSNCIRNATEAMTPPPHNPTIQITAENVQLSESEIAGLTEGTYVKLEVRDNGCGIPSDIIDQIWNPFFTTKKHGSGLGLTTSLEITRRLGGIIGVTSEVGVGSVFSIFIPVAKKEIINQASQAPTVRFKTGRLLIVESDSNIRHVLSSMLEALDYRSDGARDPEDALQQYRRYFEISRPYDAVLIDLNMSGSSGNSVLDALRAYDPEVRAIAMSSEVNDTIIATSKDQGYYGFLAKPFKLSELGSVIKTVLGS